MLNRFLPIWIAVAMGVGLGLGRLFPHLNTSLGAVKLAGTSLPIALGLLVMMYPVLAKVRYGELGRVTADRRLMVPSLILNWLVGPAVMFALAWFDAARPARLQDRPHHRRARPLHCHGADLERPRRGRPRGRRRARRLELALPGGRLRGARLLLSALAAGLARAFDGDACTSRCGRSQRASSSSWGSRSSPVGRAAPSESA